MLIDLQEAAAPVMDLVRVPLSDLVRHYRRWGTFLPDAELAAERASPLSEPQYPPMDTLSLRMFYYAPSDLPAGAPLVVVLHGCNQTAVGFEASCGWSALADRYGFALLMPEQKTSNNTSRCFNWFKATEARRNYGECRTISRMAQFAADGLRCDPGRVFVIGLSAGGSMANALLASYPDVFAGGAIVAGLPFGCARSAREALAAMRTGCDMPARALGNLVRDAAPRPARWPVISVWHGCLDQTVHPANAESILRQWTDVRGLAESPAVSRIHTGGHMHRTWLDAQGEIALESHVIPTMGHAFPVNQGRTAKVGKDPYVHAYGLAAAEHMIEFLMAARPGNMHRL